jgi:hypothetical protein
LGTLSELAATNTTNAKPNSKSPLRTRSAGSRPARMVSRGGKTSGAWEKS